MRLFLLLAILGTAATGASPAAGSKAAGESTQANTKLPAGYEGRVRALEAARQERPRDLAVLDALAGSYTMAGQYEKAIAVLREIQAMRRNDPSLQLRIARNQAWAKKTRLAIDSYQVYLLARPDDRQATIELIRLRRYRGDYSQAEQLCDKLLASNPDDAEVLALKAEVLHWAGNRRLLVRRTADHAARVAADLPDAKVAQVYALRDLGENRRAQQEFGNLRDRSPGAAGSARRRPSVMPTGCWKRTWPSRCESPARRPIRFTTTPTASTTTFGGCGWPRRCAAIIRCCSI